MQQVVFFSADFEKEMENSGKNGNGKSFFQPVEVNFQEPYARQQEILEKYKGTELGLPEEWFHFDDRIQVNILEKVLQVEGNPKMLLLLPKGGTPVKLIVNDDYAENPMLTVRFITNINFGDQEAVKAFEQECDEKLVRFQGNIQLLNEQVKAFKQLKEEKGRVPAGKS